MAETNIPANSGEETALAADEKMLQDLQDQVTNKDLKIQELETQLASAGGLKAELDSLKEVHQKSSAEVNRLSEALSSALGKYRLLVLSTNPDIPEELIQGNSLGEINSSLEKAKVLVEKIRQKVQNHSVSIPAGAPARTGVNLEQMTPREKIQYALRRG